ncbi:hypothetical protein [Micavibrio aeruginosavorus]|uniref:hypothetical protein n=1 Tax=Micavibrio aeruginosavorus TaxID=349221 RepID=UPI003F4AE1A9
MTTASSPQETEILRLCGRFTEAACDKMAAIGIRVPDKDWVEFQRAVAPFIAQRKIPVEQLMFAVDSLVPLCRRMFGPSELAAMVPDGLKTPTAVNYLSTHKAHNLARLCGMKPVLPF